MRIRPGHVKRDLTAKRAGAALPDGAGGTIAGGPMRPIALPAFRSASATGADPGISLGVSLAVSVGGAVSGAAQAVITGSGGRAGSLSTEPEPGFALSDGSRIIFASVDRMRVLTDA